jgi:hypothetical protein
MDVNSYRNVDLPDYDEEKAVIALSEHLDEVAGALNDAYDKAEAIAKETSTEIDYNLIDNDSFQVIMGGYVHAFVLGGPQMQGLGLFMKNICEENGYDVPWVERPDPGKVQKFINDNRDMLEKIRDRVADVEHIEYMDNLFEAEPFIDKNIFYVLSRLVLTLENLPDELDYIDEDTMLRMLIVDLSSIIAQTCDK